jgi:hypothetical protein
MSSLQSQTVILNVTFHLPSNERKGSLSDVQVDADKDSLRLSKEFIRSDTYKKLRGMRNETNKALANLELTGQNNSLADLLQAGAYMIPVACLDDLWPKLEKIKAEYNQLGDKLAYEEWTAVIEDAKKRLRDQFDPRNYPSADRFRRKIWVDWRLIQFSTPDNATLGEALYEQEKQKAQDAWRDAECEVAYALRSGLSKLVNHLVDILQVGPDGSKKNLHSSTVDKVNDFLDTFGKRNILNDDELKDLVNKAKLVLDGKNVEDLKIGRNKIGADLQQVGNELSQLVKSTKRAIRFKD